MESKGLFKSWRSPRQGRRYKSRFCWSCRFWWFFWGCCCCWCCCCCCCRGCCCCCCCCCGRRRRRRWLWVVGCWCWLLVVVSCLLRRWTLVGCCLCRARPRKRRGVGPFGLGRQPQNSVENVWIALTLSLESRMEKWLYILSIYYTSWAFVMPAPGRGGGVHLHGRNVCCDLDRCKYTWKNMFCASEPW